MEQFCDAYVGYEEWLDDLNTQDITENQETEGTNEQSY
jgi:hypothetical protein